jgi:23S rRNA pseudouridine1911/1915/1917 synthase
MKELSVDASLQGKRFDEALAIIQAAPSRSKAQEMIKEKKALVNNQAVKAHYILNIADVITYQEYTERPLTIEGEDIPLDVIYEDEDILIVDKPAGLVVHPGNGHWSGALVNALVFRESHLSSADGPLRPGLVHRIDKDTSGLLAIAKNDRAYESLARQLADHSMHREYYALVKGIIYEDDGKIDAPIGRDPIHPTKFCVDVAKGKEAITFFHVLQRFDKGYTFLSCRLLTGRTHQIRVHMEYIGHPIIGDPLYGTGNRSLYDKGQLLHAYRLTLAHPRDGRKMTFEAPLPKAFRDVLAALK